MEVRVWVTFLKAVIARMTGLPNDGRLRLERDVRISVV